MRGGDARARAHLRHMRGALLNGVNAVVDIVGLAAAVQLTAQGLSHKAAVIFHYIRLHRAALYGRLLDGAHVAQAAHGHAQRARDGRGGERQHIHAEKGLFQLFLMLYAEALLFVHNDKAQVFELYILLQKAVCTHHKVHCAVRKAAQGGTHLLWGGKAGQKSHLHREGLHARGGRLVVLPRQDGGGHQDGALLAPHDALEGGAQGHLGFAHAYVAAQKAVHGVRALHILFYLGRAGKLVVRLVVLKARFEIALPVAVRREGIASGLLAAGIKLDKLFGHLLRGPAHARFGFSPCVAAQLRQFYALSVARGGVAADNVQLRHGHIQAVALVVLYFQVILYNAL